VFNVKLNRLIKNKRSWSIDEIHVSPGKSLFFSHENVSYTTDF